jgi:hypothetical protein
MAGLVVDILDHRVVERRRRKVQDRDDRRDQGEPKSNGGRMSPVHDVLT